MLDAYAKSEYHESVFEIQANYLGSGEADFMDTYRVQNVSYGVQVENVGRGRGHDRHVRISWSPMTMLEPEGLQYGEMRRGVIYKVYLGFNNETLDLFSSLC